MTRSLLRFGGIVLAVAWLGGAVGMAESSSSLGEKLLEQGRYGEAVAVLRPALSGAGAVADARTALVLGVACLKNAELHRTLHRASVDIHLDYLKRLSAERGKDRSVLAPLYLGDALLAAGRPREAGDVLEAFLAGKGAAPEEKAVARVLLGLCHLRLGSGEKARRLFAGAEKAGPGGKAELAAALSLAGPGGRDPVAMGEEALEAARRAGGRPSARVVRNLIRIYAREGLVDKGLDLLASFSVKECSREEVLGKHKVIRFYDISLLDDLATLYGRASLGWLEKAASDTRYGESAVLSLARAHLLLGDAPHSARAADALLAPSRTATAPYRDRAAVLKAESTHLGGRKTETAASFESLSRERPKDADLMAEILLACSRLAVACPGVAERAAGAAESMGGKRLKTLSFALGRYHLGRGNHTVALSFLEAGRDKGNKNRIESNDPQLLASLAEAYYRTRNFSEAQEIYFAMAKAFPEVRQIQEALQGVYTREQKSPGDVRIL